MGTDEGARLTSPIGLAQVQDLQRLPRPTANPTQPRRFWSLLPHVGRSSPPASTGGSGSGVPATPTTCSWPQPGTSTGDGKPQAVSTAGVIFHDLKENQWSRLIGNNSPPATTACPCPPLAAA